MEKYLNVQYSCTKAGLLTKRQVYEGGWMEYGVVVRSICSSRVVVNFPS